MTGHGEAGIVTAMASPEAKAPLYRPLFPLAQGGLGEVTLVLRTEGDFKRLYAMKRLHRRFASDEDIHRMFLAEARLAGLLRHANIVSVLDVGRDTRGPYLVMELVEGVTVADLLRKYAEGGELIPLTVVLDIVVQAARGLDALHRLRALDGEALHIVHRDVSPQNLLLGYDGVVQLTDFGIAKDLDRSQQTTTGVVRGKRGYMSPEQVRMEPLSARADLFSLGVVLWELLSGQRLYGAREEKSSARQIMEDAPPDPVEFRSDVPPALSEVVFDLLAKEPSHRPSTAREVVERLHAILSDLERPEELSTFLAEVFHREKVDFAQRVQEAVEATVVMPCKAPGQAKSRWRQGAALAIALMIGGSALAYAGLGKGANLAAIVRKAEPADDAEMASDAASPPMAVEPAETMAASADMPLGETETERALDGPDVEMESAEEAVSGEERVAPATRERRPRRGRPSMSSMRIRSQMAALGDDTWWEP